MIECLERGSNILPCIIFDCKATLQSLAIACALVHICVRTCAYFSLQAVGSLLEPPS